MQHVSDLHLKFALRPHHVWNLKVWQTSNLRRLRLDEEKKIDSLELECACGPMPNVVALPNIGGALCSTPQSLAGAHYLTAVR